MASLVAEAVTWGAVVRVRRRGPAARTPALTGPPGRSGPSAAAHVAAAPAPRSGSVSSRPSALAAFSAPANQPSRRSATRRSAPPGQNGQTGHRYSTARIVVIDKPL